jgi:hypothetical protein
MGKTEKTFNRIAKYLAKVYQPRFGEVVLVSKKLTFCRESIGGYSIEFFNIKVSRPTTDFMVFTLPLDIDIKEFDVSKLVKDIWVEIQNHVPVQNSPVKYSGNDLKESERNTCINAIEVCMSMYHYWNEDKNVNELVNKLKNMSYESKNTSESVQSAR